MLELVEIIFLRFSFSREINGGDFVASFGKFVKWGEFDRIFSDE